jgi:AcrR family transcriptional regulator
MTHSPRRRSGPRPTAGQLAESSAPHEFAEDTGRSRRAEEILDEAMRLFAEQGYAATSVAHIQQAAGMTPGSGALYKHFPSKRALLEAGVERFVGQGAAAANALPDVTDLETGLRQVGASVLTALARDQETMRVAWRDLPAFPDLSRRFVDARLQYGFAQLAGWLADLDRVGVAVVEDPEATAAVLLGALAFFRVMDTMLGETPGRVNDEAFLAAWVRLAVRALAPDDDSASRRS